MARRRRPQATDLDIEPNDLLEEVLDAGEDPRKHGFDARKMLVEPRRMRRLLASEGFVTKASRRGRGVNVLEFVRPSPVLDGLFEILGLHGSLDGESVRTEFWLSLVPSGDQAPILVSVGGDVAKDGLFPSRPSKDIRTDAEAREFERRLCEALPGIRAELVERQGLDLLVETQPARDLVDCLLRWLQPGRNPYETHRRLTECASPEQAGFSQRLYANCMAGTFGLERFRVLYDIVGLSFVLSSVPDLEGFEQFEAWKQIAAASTTHRRTFRAIRLMCSRLSQETGWPQSDPLVPRQSWEEPEVTPVAESQPLPVEELANQFLESRGRTCDCGESLRYVSHVIEDRDDDVFVIVTARCPNGHESVVELDG